jgi:sensor c-di-GMP phosphodiesterase-like protein
MSAEENQVEVIDKELVRTSLYNLGKTFNNARHAYLSLNLASNALSTINVRNIGVNTQLLGSLTVHLSPGNRSVV